MRSLYHRFVRSFCHHRWGSQSLLRRRLVRHGDHRWALRLRRPPGCTAARSCPSIPTANYLGAGRYESCSACSGLRPRGAADTTHRRRDSATSHPTFPVTTAAARLRRTVCDVQPRPWEVVPSSRILAFTGSSRWTVAERVLRTEISNDAGDRRLHRQFAHAPRPRDRYGGRRSWCVSVHIRTTASTYSYGDLFDATSV